jgi:hypothetical protein
VPKNQNNQIAVNLTKENEGKNAGRISFLHPLFSSYLAANTK